MEADVPAQAFDRQPVRPRLPAVALDPESLEAVGDLPAHLRESPDTAVRSTFASKLQELHLVMTRTFARPRPSPRWKTP